MQFEPQNKLEHSLVKASQDPVFRPQFYRDFCESEIFLIQQNKLPAAEGKIVLEQEHKLEIQNVRINENIYIPVFSSLQMLQFYITDKVGYVAINALEFLKITNGAAIFLNPNAAYGKEFTSNEVQSIVDGSIWQPRERYTIEKETKVLMGQPANYPYELVDALSRLYKHKKQVKKAYLVHFHNTGRDEQPHTLIALEVTGEWDKISAESGIVIEKVRIPNPPVDFLQVNFHDRSGVQEYCSKIKPFYKRKFFNIFDVS
ncbi:MAG: SseB protein [Rickettsiaceae bacterium]|jgi:hypothetical protein|nr:SseB protein [Rickettsiaceae bacterium]